MTIEYSATCGKAKITVEVDGCALCGTQGSYAWKPIKSINLRLGGRITTIHVYVCGDCAQRKPQEMLL